MLDVLIRNAQVHDGSGEKSSQVDVGVRDGSIVAVGKTEEPARETVDAGGGTRMLRDPLGVHGLWVNGVQVFDGQKLTSPERGPGEVLRRFER